MVSRDFAQEPPSSSLRRVLLFQRIYFPLLVLRDPLWPRETVGWGDWCQGGYEPLTRKVCSSKCGPWWHKAPRILASFGCANLLSRFTTAAKLLTAWSLWWSKGLWAQTGPWDLVPPTESIQKMLGSLYHQAVRVEKLLGVSTHWTACSAVWEHSGRCEGLADIIYRSRWEQYAWYQKTDHS